jgi:cytoplasmic iron level regulating protein YaaA (DUF328/UPF0246 family)
VLILLPPSEGKSAAAAGEPLDLDGLGFPPLRQPREQTLAALLDLSRGDPETAARTLGLGPTQMGEVERNAGLLQEPTAPAAEIYSGVLFAALDVAGLSVAQRRRSQERLVIASALFGLVRPQDRIPAYRLNPGVRLPGIPTPKQVWGAALREALEATAGGLVVDLRSGAYAQLYRPRRGSAFAEHWVAPRVVTEREGRRVTVSHHSKHHKGLLARDLLSVASAPSNGRELVAALLSLGWDCRSGPRAGLDIVV